MTNYWCVTFDFEECLKYGLSKRLWMMQYQYALDEENVFQGDRKYSVKANWRRTKDIQVGDPFPDGAAWQEAVKRHFERIGPWHFFEKQHRLESGVPFQMIVRSLSPSILSLPPSS